jgi:hypothetical protein
MVLVFKFSILLTLHIMLQQVKYHTKQGQEHGNLFWCLVPSRAVCFEMPIQFEGHFDDRFTL